MKFDFDDKADEDISYKRRFIDRGNLKEKHVKLLVLHRYGSLENFDKIIASYGDISLKTRVNKCTVRNVIERYHANGNQFKKIRKKARYRMMIPRHA